MALTRFVECITKRDRTSPHERISHIGGDWGPGGLRTKITEELAISHIEIGLINYYVRIGDASVEVIVATRLGRKYLKTRADSTFVDNLLNLPNCP